MFTYLLSYMTPQKMLEMAGEILGEGSHQTTVGENCWDGVKPGRDGHDPSVCPAGVSGNPMVYRESVEEKLPGLLQLPGMLFS